MKTLWAVVASAGMATAAAAAPAQNPVDPYAMDQRLQGLKEEVLALNRDLELLQEDLLFPADTQVSVYVSLDVGELFKLESVQLLLNDQVVVNHLYAPWEVSALARGGVQRLWMGNVPSGQHQLVAFFTGVGPNGRDYRRAADLTVDKRHGAKALEIRISDRQSKLQPEFAIREWE